MSGLRPNESFEEYKKRVIDPISESYCGAKWLNATIWLGNGDTTSCHHPPGHRIDASELEENPTAIHNTKHKKAMRKMMLEGKRPQECEYCWKIEDLGRNTISDRPYKTAVYKDEDIQATVDAPWDADSTLKALEIAFNRNCNFACSYCNPSFSTTWVKDIRTYGAYRNLDGDARGHFITEACGSEPLPEGKNPYVQAFWKWWDNGLSDDLEEIRLTGGEPLLTEGAWKLFEWFKNNQEAVNNRPEPLRYAINSNLGGSDALMDQLIAATHHVPHFELYTSCESVGPHAEYIRDGLNWDKWMHNLNRLQTEGNVQRIHMMMTINSLCLASITEFMDKMFEFKIKHDVPSPLMSLNILRFPSFQNCGLLPMEMRQHYSDKLQKWLNKHIEENVLLSGGRPVFSPIEREQVQRLVDYLDVIKTPHKDVKSPEVNRVDFKQFYHQYDIRRGKDFRATFPQAYIDWVDSIETELPTREEVLNQSYRDEVNSVVEEYPDPTPSADVFINPDLKDE